jgi:vacuolar-type H+-ATPase subunit H
MPETSPAQGTLRRLIEAEDQAREILKAAEQRAQDTVAEARTQGKASVEAIRLEAVRMLRSQLEEAESKAATEMKQRLLQADAEAREFERRAAEHFSQAVDMVVDWVTRGE